MAGSFACLYCHIVFSTKNRVPLLTPEVAPRVHEYLGGVIRGKQGVPVQIGGAADHVHVLCSQNKTEALTDLIRDLKSCTTAWVHTTFPALPHFAWQEGYGAFSISVTGLDRVAAYIAGQEAHHQQESFQDELRRFLRVHGIVFDERYIWQ